MAMMEVRTNRQTSFVAVVVAVASMFSHLAAADVVTLAGDYQVIQRGADNTGAFFVPLRTEVPAGATIKYSVTLQEKAVASGEKRTDAALSKDKAGAEIAMLKPGGPYRVDVSAVSGDGNVLARVNYDNILVGDLWVVAGQSNAAGSAPVKERLARDPMVNMLGVDGVWKPAIPPTHRLVESGARVIKDLLMSKCGFKSDEQIAETGRQSLSGEHPWGSAGCDVFFASRLARETGIPQGLIPTAFGATSLEDWSPDLLSKGEASLYGNMIRSIALAGGKLRGMVWYQGEAEAAAIDPNIYSTYYERFKRFVESVRRDSKNPDMVFLTVQLGRVVIVPPEADAGWGDLREQQRLLAADVPGVYMVPAADLQLSDGIHIGWDGHKILGVRLARLALPHLMKQGERRGIDLASVRFANDERTSIQVDFKNVAGKLRSDGLPRGFTLTLPGQPARDLFFDVGFDEKQPNRVVLSRGVEIDPAAKVSYAQGLNPVANLTDEEGMAPCSFGPVDIELPGNHIVMADFEGGSYGSWTADGDAFGPVPATGTLPGQQAVDGFKGRGLVNTFRNGDRSTGTLTSPEFTIERPFITFLIGGGKGAETTAMHLVIDGKVARRAPDPNEHNSPTASETLAPDFWDVSEFVGRKAVIRIVDNATGGWGHLNVDHIVQTDRKPIK